MRRQLLPPSRLIHALRAPFASVHSTSLRACLFPFREVYGPIGVTLLAPTMITSQQRRALIAACLGWMLDAMDVMLYSLVLSSVAKELGLKPSTSGLLVAMTLVFAAVGGLVFGRLADHSGRPPAMPVCTLPSSIFTRPR